jgi:hypothetical protein
VFLTNLAVFLVVRDNEDCGSAACVTAGLHRHITIQVLLSAGCSRASKRGYPPEGAVPSFPSESFPSLVSPPCRRQPCPPPKLPLSLPLLVPPLLGASLPMQSTLTTSVGTTRNSVRNCVCRSTSFFPSYVTDTQYREG